MPGSIGPDLYAPPLPVYPDSLVTHLRSRSDVVQSVPVPSASQGNPGPAVPPSLPTELVARMMMVPHPTPPCIPSSVPSQLASPPLPQGPHPLPSVTSQMEMVLGGEVGEGYEVGAALSTSGLWEGGMPMAGVTASSPLPEPIGTGMGAYNPLHGMPQMEGVLPQGVRRGITTLPTVTGPTTPRIEAEIERATTIDQPYEKPAYIMPFPGDVCNATAPPHPAPTPPSLSQYHPSAIFPGWLHWSVSQLCRAVLKEEQEHQSKFSPNGTHKRDAGFVNKSFRCSYPECNRRLTTRHRECSGSVHYRFSGTHDHSHPLHPGRPPTQRIKASHFLQWLIKDMVLGGRAICVQDVVRLTEDVVLPLDSDPTGYFSLKLDSVSKLVTRMVRKRRGGGAGKVQKRPPPPPIPTQRGTRPGMTLSRDFPSLEIGAASLVCGSPPLTPPLLPSMLVSQAETSLPVSANTEVGGAVPVTTGH
ncbi:hypothetical protein KIPB_009177 [Kipferlia bialata]|uniref:Uncharacterized protein n=1 Tax=Kipferlia bialata TaxID=797122 RepID=A0A9K3D2S2_9EUKA|nr:hypothetical protein KIPB_009177 [Kipferlia bialata]|eukprot:g9177.t1